MAFPFLAVAGLALSAAKGVASLVSANHDNKRNWQHQQDAAALNDAYQRNLIKDQYALTRQGMNNAGMSVANLQDSSVVNSNADMSSSPAVSRDMSFFDSAIGSLQLLSAVEDIRSKRLDNENKQVDLDEKKRTGEYINSYTDDWNMFSESPSDSLDGPTVFAPSQKGYMSLERFRLANGGLRVLQAQNSASVRSSEASYHEATQRISSADLQNDVNNQMRHNTDIVQAMTNMPLEQYKQLKEAVRNLKNNNTFFEHVQKYREEAEKYGPALAYENLRQYILSNQSESMSNELQSFILPLEKSFRKAGYEFNPYTTLSKLFNGDGSWKDVGRAIVSVLASLLAPGIRGAATTYLKGLVK